MAVDRSLPLDLRLAVLRRELARSRSSRAPRRALRAIGAAVWPSRWPNPTVRAAVLDAALDSSRGQVAADLILSDLATTRRAFIPTAPAARRRAAALTVLAQGRPPVERAAELSIAAYLRGEYWPPSLDDGPPPEAIRAEAVNAVETLVALGQHQPVLVATFPGFRANPFGRLMERAYPVHGLTAVHVDSIDGVDAVADAARSTGAGLVVHLNGPDRFVRLARTEAEVASMTLAAIEHIDRWLAGRATLVTSIHNGARLTDVRAPGEQRVAQHIADRAHLIHVLTASTPALVADWITLDPARVVHVPHPNYDGAYGPLPSRADGREALRSGLVLGADDLRDDDVVGGLIGALADRKGADALLDALRDVPEPLPDGRRFRLLLGGTLRGRSDEALIRRAVTDPRVMTRFGFIPDEELPVLLASLDVAIVPYEHYLNSGWLHLALTCGIPAIAPDTGTALDVARPAALRTFRAHDRRSLAEVLAGAADLGAGEARQAARASVAANDPDLISERFATAVRGALVVTAAGAAGHG